MDVYSRPDLEVILQLVGSVFLTLLSSRCALRYVSSLEEVFNRSQVEMIQLIARVNIVCTDGENGGRGFWNV